MYLKLAYFQTTDSNDFNTTQADLIQQTITHGPLDNKNKTINIGFIIDEHDAWGMGLDRIASALVIGIESFQRDGGFTDHTFK